MIHHNTKILEPASKQSPEAGDKHDNAQLGYNQSSTEVITLNTDTNTVRDESLATANITEKVEEDAPPSSSSSSWDDMYQQLLDHKKTYGNLSIPIFDVNNPELGTWVTDRKSDYLKYMRTNKKEGNHEWMDRLEKTGLFDSIRLGKRLRPSILVWETMYQQLVDFKKKHGHARVPTRCLESPKLGTWVANRRSDYRKYLRSNRKEGNSNRMDRLEAIGVVDDILKGGEGCWDVLFDELLEFQRVNGHLNVPVAYDENPKLGTWVNRWRVKYKKYMNTNGKEGNPNRMKRLEEIGLVDDIKKGEKRTNKEGASFLEKKKQSAALWEVMFKKLEERKEKYGHLKIPTKCPELGMWTVRLRSDYRKYVKSKGEEGMKPGDQMKRLEDIGLVDDIRMGEDNWAIKFAQLEEYKRKHGHVKVPFAYNEDPKFGRWVTKCRGKYKKYLTGNCKEVNVDRMKRLESIGVVDDIRQLYKQSCADQGIAQPCKVLSSCSATKDMPSSTNIYGKNKSDLDILGSETRGGFWA